MKFQIVGRLFSFQDFEEEFRVVSIEFAVVGIVVDLRHLLFRLLLLWNSTMVIRVSVWLLFISSPLVVCSIKRSSLPYLADNSFLNGTKVDPLLGLLKDFSCSVGALPVFDRLSF